MLNRKFTIELTTKKKEVVATKAWNTEFYGSDTSSYDFRQIKLISEVRTGSEMYNGYISTPIALYYVILNKFNGSEFDLRLAMLMGTGEEMRYLSADSSYIDVPVV